MNITRRLFNFARECKRKIQINNHIPDKDWAKLCYEYSIPLDTVELVENNSLMIKFSSQKVVVLSKSLVSFSLISAYIRIIDLAIFTNCQISWNKDDENLIFSWNNITYLVNNIEELDILYEIYISGDYDYSSDTPTVIIDIGANVGFTAIFLAASNQNFIIEACEPLKVNYDKALRNFSKNPQLSERIYLHDFGLFSEDGEQFIVTEQEGRGRSSIVIDRTINPLGKVEKILVKVRRSSSFIKEIKERYPQRKIIIKMDCEGSEYEILKNLQEDGFLNTIEGFMMEWHVVSNSQFNANYIRKLLVNAGFHVYVRGAYQTKYGIGMLYAFKTV